MNPLKRPFGGPHRRSLWQALGIYAVAAWAIFEIVQTLTEGLGLPEWFPAFAFVLLLVGLPVVLATAFVQAGRPDRDGHEESLGSAGVTSKDVASQPASAEGARGLLTWRNAIGAGVLAFALWGAVAAGWLLFRAAGRNGTAVPPIGAGEARPAVAVLPFQNMSPSEENAFFADGVHEDILTHLSKVDNLTVLARTSVLRYRDTDRSVREIAAELDANAVLEGSVRRDGDEIRITVQLIDAESQGHLWAETYDRHLEDVFAVQTEIAQRVARGLEAALSPSEEERIAKQPTRSLAAYDLYLKGREAYQQYDEGGFDEAIRLFRGALELDSLYARAWAGLGDAFAQRAGRFGYSRAWADSAVQVARRAVGLDPELAEAHKALGLALQLQGQLERALEAYRRAIELDPNNYAALGNSGGVYQSMGRFDESVRVLRRATRLAPNLLNARFSLAHSYKFLRLDESAREWMDGILVLDPEYVGARLLSPQFAIYRGQMDEALAQAREIVQNAPDDAFAWTGAAGIAYMARDFEQAAAWASQSLRLAPDNELAYWHRTPTLLGMSVLKSGNLAEGRRLLGERTAEVERRIEAGEQTWDLHWDLASSLAAIGHRQGALDHLDLAYESGFRFVRWLAIDPALDEIRDEPHFEEWMTRLEADVTAMRERVLREEREAGIR